MVTIESERLGFQQTNFRKTGLTHNGKGIIPLGNVEKKYNQGIIHQPGKTR